MKLNAWNKPHIEEMRRRFLKCGIAVNEPESEESSGGLIIWSNSSLFDCRAMVRYPGITRYTLSLRLISDDPNRAIRAFRITSEWEKEIRVLEPFEQVPQEYVDWDPEEDILNNRVGQVVGPTRCREGLLLAEGLTIPATNGQTLSASITVWVYDQLDHIYSQVVDVEVVGLDDLMRELKKPRKARESVFTPLDVAEGEMRSAERAQRYSVKEGKNEGRVGPSNPERGSASQKDHKPEKTG